MSENDASGAGSPGDDADARPEDESTPEGENVSAGEDHRPGDDRTSQGASVDSVPLVAPEVDTAATQSDATEAEAIDPESLTVPLRSLHPRIRILWVLRSMISAAIAGALVAALDATVLGVGVWLPAGVTALLLVFGVVHSLLRYHVWKYEVREDALYLERGVLTRVKTVVPFVRIQHVDTSRGPTERVTGLATSVVYTAGSRGADVAIPGLTPERAEDMQRRLKQLAIAAEGDTAV